MSLPRFKRPTSARRNVKYDSFTQNVSATRLRHLQSLLAENENDNAPDAILCISGIDSRYNDGMYELMNYLLFGFFDVRKSEFERTGIEEEVIEDLLITVKRDSVEVYCNPVNYLYLLPYISHWRNIHFHCFTDTEYEDEEAAEEYKITSLIAMVKGCKKIGIPFSSTRTIHEFDIFAVEKWPIIQAFAYEGYEGGGFFTLKHEVVDISASVHNIYTFMDPVTIEILTKEHLPLIEKQWHTMMSTVDVELSSRPDALTEGKVCESLKSFYQHGLVGNPKLTDGLVPFPVVVFGTRANKVIMGQAARGEEMEGRIASSGVSGQPALTVVCQAVAPKFPLTCARTYFICPVYNPFTENLPERKTLTDFDVLTVLYQAMVEAVLEAIEIYVTTQQFDQAQSAVLEGVADRCRAVASPALQSYLSERSLVTFRIEGLDNVGGCGKTPGLHQRLYLKLATCTLWDVPSHQHPGKTLGALIFAETFQDSVILVQNSDKSIDFSTDCLVLTSHIPRYKQWTATPEDAATRKQILEELPHREVPGMGTLLSGGDSIAVLTTSSVTYPAESANLFAFEHGLVIQSPQYGAFPLLGSSLDQVAFFDGDSSNTVALLILHINVEALAWLPPHLQTADKRLILAFLPGSMAHKALYKKILIGWREESHMPEVIRAEILPPDLVPIHEDIQMRFVEEGRSSVLPSQLINFHTSLLPHIKRFMKHFEVSSVGGEVPRQELNVALQRVSEVPVKKDGQIVVNIITGVPGSHQESLVGKLKTLGKDHVRWVVLGDLGSEPKPWGFSELQELLSQTLQEHRQQLAKPDAKATRVILLNPGLMDTQDLVRAVTNHRNLAIGDIFRIGAVTVCIDPKNFFIEHKMPFPGLLNLCAEGWVNTILFTEPPLEENLELDDLQNMVRGINSNVSLILADRALITRSPDLELVLSETAFSHPDMVRARLLLTPNWHKAPPPGSKSRAYVNIVLRFKSPLDKPRFVSQLKGLKSSYKGVPYQGNVYRVQGRVRFTGSQQHQRLDFVNLTERLSTMPVPGDSSNPFFLQFWGYGLEQDRLKDWLRISAPKKPQRRPLLTRQDVTQDQIQKIHKGHHLEPLPEGWFYNGTTFVSMDGEKSHTHPNLEQFIADYIERRNVEIARHNASIPAETEDDFFL